MIKVLIVLFMLIKYKRINETKIKVLINKMINKYN